MFIRLYLFSNDFLSQSDLVQTKDVPVHYTVVPRYFTTLYFKATLIIRAQNFQSQSVMLGTIKPLF